MLNTQRRRENCEELGRRLASEGQIEPDVLRAMWRGALHRLEQLIAQTGMDTEFVGDPARRVQRALGLKAFSGASAWDASTKALAQLFDEMVASACFSLEDVLAPRSGAVLMVTAPLSVLVHLTTAATLPGCDTEEVRASVDSLCMLLRMTEQTT